MKKVEKVSLLGKTKKKNLKYYIEAVELLPLLGFGMDLLSKQYPAHSAPRTGPAVIQWPSTKMIDSRSEKEAVTALSIGFKVVMHCCVLTTLNMVVCRFLNKHNIKESDIHIMCILIGAGLCGIVNY